MTRPTKTARELRGLLGETRVRRYRLGAAVGMHPATVSLVLNERAPLTEELAARLEAAIEELAREETR